MDKYTPGMIVRIFCQDFLTYSSIECYPCPKLNMIVGPNGTGKSSLVNAIVLGLGGKINIIGRAKQLSAYVKRGCKMAKIEIELYSEPRNYIIQRTFTVENKNTWTVNGEPTTLRQVEAVIQRLNIQVDNLCQFLPQDRVQDFAKMDSKQLLENTIKTVGNNEIVDLHSSLKELREKEITLDSQTKLMKQQLEAEKKRVSRLETEVQAIQEREEMLNSIKIVERKKAWVEVTQTENHKKQIVQEKNEIVQMKLRAEQALIPFEAEIKENKNIIKAIDMNINKEIKICGEMASAVRRKFEVVANTDDHIDSINNELKRKLDAEKNKALKISALEEEIRRLEKMVNPAKEAELAEEGNKMLKLMSKNTTELAGVQARVQEFEDRISEVTRNKLRIEGALEREVSASKKKVQILSQKFQDAYRAYEWLKVHRGEFQGHIFGPIMLELNCVEDAAKFLEFTIPNRDLTAFVCENKDDMNKLLRTVRDGMGLRISVVQAPENCNRPVNDTYRADIPLQNIKKFGFWSYMIDQVDGPDQILNYLCKNYRLHQIPLGTRQTENMVDKIPDSIKSYFSDTNHHSVKISKYSNEKSFRIVKVQQCRLLAGYTNTALIADHKKSIQNEMTKLHSLNQDMNGIKSHILKLEQERDELRKQKKNLDQELMNLRTGRSKLKMRNEELKSLINEGSFDEISEKMKAKEKICKLVVKICTDQKDVQNYLKNYQSSQNKNVLHMLKLSKAQTLLKKKQEDSIEAKKKLDNSKRMLLAVEEKLKLTQKKCEQARENALKLTDNLNPKDAAFKRRYEKAFAKLSNDLEELDAEISRLLARADCLAGGRESVLEEYDKTQKTIARLEKAVANPELTLQHLKEEMEKKRSSWMQQVTGLIGRINNNFTEFFRMMKCVGEVSLEEPEEKNDYKKYGICIKVQFRESSKLQKLGPHTQSGGERAVSTAIYMLSLQELTTVPFRCVDEINQGMDEPNERLIFKLMVTTNEQPNSAQCFLLTPKILHSLEYSNNVQVLCIYSGIASVTHYEFKVTKFFDKLRQKNERLKRESLKRKHLDSDSSD